MATRRLVVGLLVAAVALAALAWWRSDRRRLHRRLDELEALMEKHGVEDQLTSFGKVRQLVEAFAPGFLVVARPFEGAISDRQELAAVVASYRSSVARLTLQSQRRELTIDGERGTARMRYLVDAVSDGDAGPGRQRFDFLLDWMEEEGAWLLHDVELLGVEASAEGGGP